jgi:hypothetical protein
MREREGMRVPRVTAKLRCLRFTRRSIKAHGELSASRASRWPTDATARRAFVPERAAVVAAAAAARCLAGVTTSEPRWVRPSSAWEPAPAPSYPSAAAPAHPPRQRVSRKERQGCVVCDCRREDVDGWNKPCSSQRVVGGVARAKTSHVAKRCRVRRRTCGWYCWL